MSNYVRAHIDISELADLRAQLAEALAKAAFLDGAYQARIVAHRAALARAEKAEASRARLLLIQDRDNAELFRRDAQLAEAEKVIEALEAIGNRNREGTPWPLDLKLRGTLAAYRAKYPKEQYTTILEAPSQARDVTIPPWKPLGKEKA